MRTDDVFILIRIFSHSRVSISQRLTNIIRIVARSLRNLSNNVHSFLNFSLNSFSHIKKDWRIRIISTKIVKLCTIKAHNLSLTKVFIFISRVLYILKYRDRVMIISAMIVIMIMRDRFILNARILTRILRLLILWILRLSLLLSIVSIEVIYHLVYSAHNAFYDLRIDFNHLSQNIYHCTIRWFQNFVFIHFWEKIVLLVHVF